MGDSRLRERLGERLNEWTGRAYALAYNRVFARLPRSIAVEFAEDGLHDAYIKAKAVIEAAVGTCKPSASPGSSLAGDLDALIDAAVREANLAVAWLSRTGASKQVINAAKRAANLACLRSYGHFVDWFVKVAYRCALDRRRRKVRGPQPEPDDPPGPDRGPRACSPEVWECLNQLPPQSRRILLLCSYYRPKGRDRMTDQDIGELEFLPDGRTPAARAQQAGKLRKKAEEELRRLLLAKGLDPKTWKMEPEDDGLDADTGQIDPPSEEAEDADDDEDGCDPDT